MAWFKNEIEEDPSWIEFVKGHISDTQGSCTLRVWLSGYGEWEASLTQNMTGIRVRNSLGVEGESDAKDSAVLWANLVDFDKLKLLNAAKGK